MKKQPEFHWDEETKTTICIITDDKGHVHVGEAFCHQDDFDMGTQLVGSEIAYRRAKIQQLCWTRDNEIIPSLNALKQLYYSMNRSSKFNEKSYENYMLQRQIHLFEFDLATIKEMLVGERKSLKAYIDEKDKFYKSVRKRRALGKTD